MINDDVADHVDQRCESGYADGEADGTAKHHFAPLERKLATVNPVLDGIEEAIERIEKPTNR